MPNSDDKNQPGMNEGNGREDESPAGESIEGETIEGETIEETIRRYAARPRRVPVPEALSF